MKRNTLILGISAICLLAASLVYVIPQIKENALRGKQEALARSLGVQIEQHAYQSNFPTDYFYSILKPGMTYDDVHKIVRGYQSVYRCYGTDEIYYFFSSKEDEAIRFALYYDDLGRFIELQGEDPDSRTLGLGPGCSAGLLGKP